MMGREQLTAYSRRTWRREVIEASLRAATRLVGSRLLRELELSKIRKIIILQLQNVGDSVAFTPALRAIRTQFPNAKIDLLCSPIASEFYRKCPYVDGVITDHWFHARLRGLRSELRLLRAIRRHGYDLAITDASQTSASYGLLSFATGAHMRLGFGVENRGFLYTAPLLPVANDHFIRDNLRIAEALGARGSSNLVECYFDEQDIEYARSIITALGTPNPVFAIHPVANWQSKTWFPDRWAAVADALSERHGGVVLFVGTAAERDYIGTIQGLMRSAAHSVAGQTNLSQLAALLSHCQLFLGTDSGPRHIAAGTQRLQITIMSSQDYRTRWDFRRSTEIILRTDPPCSPCFQPFCSHRRCMAEISVQTVLDACDQLLGTCMPRSESEWASRHKPVLSTSPQARSHER